MSNVEIAVALLPEALCVAYQTPRYSLFSDFNVRE